MHLGAAAFGEVVGGGSVVCVSPNVSGVADAAVAVELSLNGQDFTSQALTFTRHAPRISAVHPTAGPTHAGFRIEVSGGNLSGGSAYRCRFERPPPNASDGDASVVAVVPAALSLDATAAGGTL